MQRIREIICIDLDTNKLDGIGYPLLRVFNGNIYPAEIDGVEIELTDADLEAIILRGIKVYSVSRY